MLPNKQLLARAFYRRSISFSPSTYRSIRARTLLTDKYHNPNHLEKPANGIKSRAQDHVVETADNHNIQIDSSREGMKAKAEGYGGSATTERDLHQSNRTAQEEIPEAPGPVSGMNDERGASGLSTEDVVNEVEVEKDTEIA